MKGRIYSREFTDEHRTVRLWTWVLYDASSRLVVDTGASFTWARALAKLQRSWYVTEPVWGGRVDRPSSWRAAS